MNVEFVFHVKLYAIVNDDSWSVLTNYFRCSSTCIEEE